MQQAVTDLRAGLDQMLAVIEDQKEFLGTQVNRENIKRCAM
jgi:hypothetical protein